MMQRFLQTTIRPVFVLLVSIVSSSISAAGNPETPETLRRAVEAVSPRLVRIDTIGGREKVESEFANEGAGSGVLLNSEGYILTAAFLFLHDPSSILITLSDDTKKIARKVSTDRNRMVTLLKVEGLENSRFSALPDIRTVVRPKESIQVGESCFAVGVTLSRTEPNVARGIVSGKNRIWGKALQTDAAVGPNNYGGPLLDRQGKLLGLLAPLSMMSDQLTAGAETYDAGVGMAVPFEDMLVLLDRMKKGEDLEPAFFGLGFKENRTFIGRALIDTIQPDSPAFHAGLKPGDEIVALDDRPTDSALAVSIDFKNRYAGETLKLTIRRDGKEQVVSLKAVSKDSDKPKAT